MWAKELMIYCSCSFSSRQSRSISRFILTCMLLKCEAGACETYADTQRRRCCNLQLTTQTTHIKHKHLLGCSLLAAVIFFCYIFSDMSLQKKALIWHCDKICYIFCYKCHRGIFFSLKSPVTGGHVTGMSIVTL